MGQEVGPAEEEAEGPGEPVGARGIAHLPGVEGKVFPGPIAHGADCKEGQPVLEGELRQSEGLHLAHGQGHARGHETAEPLLSHPLLEGEKGTCPYGET